VVFYPRVGNMIDDVWGSLGPGVVLMNAGLTPTSAFSWIHDTVDQPRIAGDVVVLCTHGGDVYSEAVYSMAPFNSVQTVLVPPQSTASDVQLVADRLATAEVVFLADGEASAYAAWGSTPIAAALRKVYGHGGVVAGAGGGAAALGWAVLTSQVDSATALADPYASSIELTRGAFGLPALLGTFIDSNEQSADRFGVLAAMTARAIADGLAGTSPSAAMGIGLDGNAALAIDRFGDVTLLDDGGGSAAAWIVHGSAVDRVTAGQPLLWSKAQVTRFDSLGETLAAGGACGTAFSYDVAVDGSAASAFTPADPYDAQGTATPCPP
jgi:cyanophycinase-like exopeptidase